MYSLQCFGCIAGARKGEGGLIFLLCLERVALL